MKMIRYRNNWGLVIVLLLILVLSPRTVFAAQRAQLCDENSAMISRYGMKLEETSSGQYKLSFSKNESKFKNIKFTITKVNGESRSGTLSYGNPYTFSASENSEGIVRVDFQAYGSDNTDQDCPGNNDLWIEYASYCGAGCKPHTGKTQEKIDYSGFDFNPAPAIECGEGEEFKTKYPDETSFEYKFCYVKYLAEKNGNSTDLGTREKFSQDEVQALWCGVTFCTSEDQEKCVPTDTSYTMEDERYYKNKDYFYAYSKKSFPPPVYNYHYAPGDETGLNKQAANGCVVECKEAVVAEYGPPVATKAGLCFEYKVKVTSRVSCEMVQKPSPPEYTGIDKDGNPPKDGTVDVDYCLPNPSCNAQNGGWYGELQGGPNEDFEECVEKCDGGKYTSKCSKKCYKEVYGTSTSKTSSADRSVEVKQLKYPLVMKDEIEKCITDSEQFSVGNGGGNGIYKGCYYYENTAQADIKWQGIILNGSEVDAWHQESPGRWYYFNSGYRDLSPYATGKTSYKEGETVIKAYGFYRRKHYDSAGNFVGLCDDNCYWYGCDKGQYLNPGTAGDDAERNIEIYEEEMKKCQAAASCTTNEAEFSISAEYDTVNYNGEPENKPVKVYFPYTDGSNHPEKLTGAGEKCEVENSLNQETTTILQYGGCYMKECSPNIWYMTEWSFPGSWINNKTAEVSFVPKEKGWQKAEKKFCTPLNAADVNEKWWNYYYKQTLVDKEETSVERSAYKEKCVKESYADSIENVTTITKDDIEKWNIVGSTTNFGHFGWNIDMNCFYAINSIPAASTDADKTAVSKEDDCKVDETNYRIRSVDLENIFPDKDGNTISTPSETGRAQGFNWTNYAKPGGTDGVATRTVTVSNGNSKSIGAKGTAVNNETAPVTSYSVKASPYVIEPEKYIEKVQSEKNSVYEGEDYLDYYFYLTPKIMQELKKDGKDFNDFAKGDTAQDTIVYYQSDVFRKNINFDVAHYPDTSVLSCNNIRNYRSTECES